MQHNVLSICAIVDERLTFKGHSAMSLGLTFMKLQHDIIIRPHTVVLRNIHPSLRPVQVYRSSGEAGGNIPCRVSNEKEDVYLGLYVYMSKQGRWGGS